MCLGGSAWLGSKSSSNASAYFRFLGDVLLAVLASADTISDAFSIASLSDLSVDSLLEITSASADTIVALFGFSFPLFSFAKVAFSASCVATREAASTKRPRLPGNDVLIEGGVGGRGGGGDRTSGGNTCCTCSI